MVHQIFGVIAIFLSETCGLKAQPLLAQGNALGIQSRCDYALQGQKPNSCTCEVKLLRFQRDCSSHASSSGCRFLPQGAASLCPGLGACWAFSPTDGITPNAG